MSLHTNASKRYGAVDPTRRMVGWGTVVLIHAIILWLLISGTGRDVLKIVKKPLEAAVIQEVIIPPPPPPPPPPPKRVKKPMVKQEAPPPPFVPPPEVTPPTTSAPTIQSVQTPPPTPAVIAPPPPPAAPTGRQDIGVACPQQVKPEMPKQALKEGIEGIVKAQATIRNGRVVDVQILSGPRVYHNAVRQAMMQYQCVSGAGDILATQEFGFKIE